MLYRRLPARPPRLLLRVMATAGAGALLGVAACGGESTTITGSPVSPAPDGADAQSTGDDASTFMGFVVGMPMGLVGNPGVADAGEDATLACGGRLCGAVAILPDSGDVTPDAGPDGGEDASASDGAIQDDAGGVGLHCPPVCGVVVGVMVHP